MGPVDVVQAQLDAYNRQDVDAFMSVFAEDCIVGDLNGAVSERGKGQVRARYEKLFADFPENQARLVNRVAVGEVVIDHEDITRAPGNGFKAAAIYTVKEGLIARVDFVREL